jgi:hypothetical protein
MTGIVPRPCRMAGRTALALLTLALVVPLALAVPFGAAAGADYDCVDFDSREDAQEFYEESGGPENDPYNLDDDADGIACEEWKREYERSAAGENGRNGHDAVDNDCADFPNQRAAQRYFTQDGGSATENVDRLDPNQNGIACEEGEPG